MTGSPLPVLYSFRRCPYAMRARMALVYSRIPVALREVELAAKPPQMLAASPKGTVPVLVLPGANGAAGEVIDESLDIMFWALAQSDPDGWLDIVVEDANRLLIANDEQFKPWLDRYKYPEWHDDAEPGEAQAHCERFLGSLEARLARQGCLARSQPAIVDFALLPFVRQYALVDPDGFAAAPFPALRRWLQEMTAMPLFSQVMQKYPRWQPGAELTVLGG